MAVSNDIPFSADDAQLVQKAMSQLELTADFADLSTADQFRVLELAVQLKRWSRWGKAF